MDSAAVYYKAVNLLLFIHCLLLLPYSWRFDVRFLFCVAVLCVVSSFLVLQSSENVYYTATIYLPQRIKQDKMILLLSPRFFLKKRRGYCYRLRPSVHLYVRPLCYLLLNHWTKFNQIWCVSYSHEWGAQRIFFAPPPGALGRVQKVKYHLISIAKSISKIFIPNFVCVLTKENYKTYQTGFFLFCRLGYALGVGLGGT